MAENVGAVSFGVNLDGSGVGNQINSLGTSIGATFRGIVSNAFSFALGQGFFSLIQSGFRNGIEAAIDFDSSMQQNNISFTTMLGNAAKAQQFMSWAQQFAASTPFSMDDVVTGSKRLLAFGFQAEQIPKMLQAIGDASSAMGMSGSEGIGRISEALGQMSAHGTVDAQDMMQLTSVGIPAWDILAQSMHKSTAEVMDMSSKGLIPANQAINALVDGMESRFPNMMAAQSKSFSGLMSTLQDNVVSTLGSMVQPEFEHISNTVLPKLIDTTGMVSSTFKATGDVIQALAAGIDTAFGKKAGDDFYALASGIRASIGWIADHGTLVTTVIGSIAGAVTAFKVATIAATLPTTIHNGLLITKAIATKTATIADGTLTTATGIQTSAQWALNAAFLANPITLVVIGIAALVAALAVLFVRNQAFHAFVVSAFAQIRDVVIGAFTQVQAVIMPIVQVIRQTLTAAWSVVSSTILSGLQTVQAWWNKIWPELSSVLSTVWGIIKNVISGAFLLIYPIISSYLGFIRGLWTGVWGIIRDTFIGVWNIIVDVVKMVWGVISNEVKAGLDLVSGLFTVFKYILSGNWSGAWHALVDTVRNVGGDLWGAVQNLFGGVWNILGDVASTAENWGRDIIQGIVNGIRDAAWAVGDAVSGVAQNIRSFLHFSVPDQGPLVDFQSWMPDFIGSLATGITDNKSVLTSAVSGMAMDLNSAVKTGVNGALGSVNINSGMAKAAQSGGVSYTEHLTVNSPKALSPSEVARQARNARRQFVLRTVTG